MQPIDEFADDFDELTADYTPPQMRGIPTREPSVPRPGDLWFNTDNSTLFIRMDDDWVAMS